MLSQSKSEYVCEECKKRYSEYSHLQIHLRHKHKQTKHYNRPNISEQQIYQFEDKFFSFLGELSEVYSENTRASQSQSVTDQPRFTGQANYLPNSIVRTPYQSQINVPAEIPQNYQFHPNINILLTQDQISSIKKQIDIQLKQLSQQLQQERSKWEFADPYDETINFQDEFSVLDVAKLVKNFPTRNLDLKIPQLSLFLTWVGRILKPEMFKLIYEILVSETLCFQNFLKAEKIKRVGRLNFKCWVKFINSQRNLSEQFQKYEQTQQLQHKWNRIRCYIISLNWKKIKVKNLEKILQFYQMWMELIWPGIPSVEKKSSQGEKQNGKEEI